MSFEREAIGELASISKNLGDFHNPLVNGVRALQSLAEDLQALSDFGRNLDNIAEEIAALRKQVEALEQTIRLRS